MSALGSRILVAVVLLPLVIGVAYLGGWWLFALALAGGLIALHELYTMARELRPLVIAGYAGFVLTLLGLELGGIPWMLGGILSTLLFSFVVFGLHTKVDIHVHYPEGAVPKDGPSAGITAATCLVSALTHTPVRADVAMTGEITLRGRVLPIGGLKEKILAAHRGRIRTVILPLENRKDIHDIPTRILKVMRLVLVDHMDQVLGEALSDPAIARRVGDPAKVVVYENGSLVRSSATVDAGPEPPRPSPQH
ncbi:MAG: S16 family serine protease [Gaiellaceae bacterium]